MADQPGVGIGLFLTREIIQAQKGYIKVTSEREKGSIFSVFLPISKKEEYQNCDISETRWRHCYDKVCIVKSNTGFFKI